MTDLIARLRSESVQFSPVSVLGELMEEAATALEQLQRGLRKVAITTWYYQSDGKQSQGGRCLLCDRDWTGSELHAPECLAHE